MIGGAPIGAGGRGSARRCVSHPRARGRQMVYGHDVVNRSGCASTLARDEGNAFIQPRMRAEIIQMILEAVRELNEELKLPALVEPAPQTRLFGGSSGALDSMALVSLIADLEGRIATKF